MIIQKLQQNTFLIHDYETFGKNPASDRPSQFAGIRTDYHFNPLENEENFFCRLSNDYLPNPEAILLTEINPMHLLHRGFKEYKFAKKIQEIFNVPKTCILGYNNIRFDNEFSRHIFYRNFYDPYNWSWKNENSNWDVLHIMRAFYILRPEGIKWPLNEKGNPSFRLADLSKHNNITHNKKHDALSDVYATLKLAKLAQKTQPKLFDFLYYYRKKQTLKKLINLNITKALLYIPIHTLHNHSIIWISPLIWHPNNPNLLIACNLNINLDILLKNNNNLLNNQNLTSYNQHHQTILIFIHINKCPILTPINSLRPQDITRLNINPHYFLNNLKTLKQQISNNNNIIKQIIKTTINSYDTHNKILNIKYKKLHVDHQLYTGFFNKNDQDIINKIHNITPKILSNTHMNFFDDRLKKLLFFYRARNFPKTLNNKEKNDWLTYRKKIFTKEKLQQYTTQLDFLFQTYKKHEKKTKLLNSLIKYIEHINTTLQF